jgi:hypothetical protein
MVIGSTDHAKPSPRRPFSPGEEILLSTFVEAALSGPDGDRLERIVVFGSRARAQGHEDSDLDLAVFVLSATDPGIRHRLTDLATDAQAGWEDLPILRVVVIGDDPTATRPTLLGEIERDGIELWAKKSG